MSGISLPKPLYIFSDGTGDTAEKVVRAALHQFNGYLVHIQVFPNVTERDQLERLYQRAAKDRALVATTLVRPDMRTAALEFAQQHRVRTVELLGHLLNQMTKFLEAAPEGVPGRMHQADDRYFERIEAVEFTVKADDGKEPRLLKQADILLLGVSRTSKTPLSVFLAHKGYKVSNVPIVLDRPLPNAVFEVDQNRIFGLTIDPESLRHIRHQRMETMRMPGRTNYSDMDYILAELEWADDLFRRNPSWPVIDVTRKAVEETAATILKVLGERGISWDSRESGQL
jgi:regulator of PEP synthase PpsR (kinase-PPPase family)